MRAESERRLSSDQYKYIPSQPNITPHYMLFGHNKEDVLKKVLQQINQKMKWLITILTRLLFIQNAT